MAASELLRSMRPQQWTKNLVVFAALIFSMNLTQTDLLLRTTIGFLVFCGLSGFVYVLNDLKDRDKDRVHPKKSLRPIASGRLPVTNAVIGLAVLLAGGLTVAAWLGQGFLLTSVAFVLLNALYSFVLRSKVLLDVIAISTGFVLRALAGAEVLIGAGTDVRISPWLLLCTFFLSLFLGLGKRRHELKSVSHEHRRVLRAYSVELVDRLTTVTVAITVLCYSIYTIWPDTVENFGTEALVYTVPFVFFGLTRYLYLVTEEDKGGDPSEMLLTDRSISTTVVLWVLVVVWIVYGG